MSIFTANQAKINSDKNQPKKSLDVMRGEIANLIKQCSDAGFYEIGYIIPTNTTIEDQEAILGELNTLKYSIQSSSHETGLALIIKWSQPLH